MSKKITAVLTRSLGHIQLEFEDGTSEMVTREANAGQDLKVGDWWPAPEKPVEEIKTETPAPETPVEQAAQPSGDPTTENEAQKPAEEETTQLFDSVEEEAQPKKKKK